MLKYSFFYRLLSCSWFLGWMTAYSPERARDYYAGSLFHRLGRRAVDSLVRMLLPPGRWLQRLAAGSTILNNLTIIAGVILFIYFLLGSLTGGYGIIRQVLYMVIALAALVLPLAARKIPGLWQGSSFLSFFRWWVRTD